MFPAQVELVEVGLRDGLQSEVVMLTTEQKLAQLDGLISAGLKRIQVASFVNPNRVPQMADAEAPRPCDYKPGAEQIQAGVFQPLFVRDQGIKENLRVIRKAEIYAVEQATRFGVSLVVMPELFHLLTSTTFDLIEAAHLSTQMVEIVAVPCDVKENWEWHTGFRERAAENRMNVVVSCHARHTELQILTISPDFTLWTEWKNRTFDGSISKPIVTHGEAVGLSVSEIYPAAAGNRLVSQQTVPDG